MSKTAAPKQKSSVGAALVIALIFAGLALSHAGGHQGGAGGGGGGDQTNRYLPDDPCPRGTPGWRLAAPEWAVTLDGEQVRMHLTCAEWRRIVNKSHDSRPRVNDIINCIGNIIDYGVHTSGGGVRLFNLHFTGYEGLPALAQVVVTGTSGELLSAAVSHAAWADCAAA